MLLLLVYKFFIKLPFDNAFIATQGPLDDTIEHFWEMVFEKKSKLIVMLCNIKEKDRIKCARYWPEKVLSFSNFSVEHLSTNEEENLVTRKSNQKSNSIV